ncbi:MAG TPA: hypothetical protein VLG47_03890 [Candidatus Saccharimonadales bacterium]|nr:hypothetical protein [Candidatus Saccharimonadales bacterium]
MPNFWTGFGRMMAGKPIYDPDDPDIKQYQTGEDPGSLNPSDQSAQPAAPIDPFAKVPGQPNANGIIKGREDTFPKLQIRRIDNHYRGDDVEVYFRIYNPTNIQLWIENIKVCGHERRIRDDLRPHQEQQYSVYNGHCMKSNREREVKIKFRTMDGDYFEIAFEINYRYLKEHDIYEFDRAEQHHAVRDTYESPF